MVVLERESHSNSPPPPKDCLTRAYIFSLFFLTLRNNIFLQLKFDAHMTGMEDTMRNIQKDGMEVRLMRRGLDAGLAKALLVLEETKMK